MKILLTILFITSIAIKAQVAEEQSRVGTITYKSSKQVFASFESTEGIKKGDMLFVKINEEYVPAIIVEKLSGSSCSGKLLVEDLTVDTRVFTQFNPKENSEELSIEVPEQKIDQVDEIASVQNLTAMIPVVNLEEENEAEEESKENPVEIIKNNDKGIDEITNIPNLAGSKANLETNNKEETLVENTNEIKEEKNDSTLELTYEPVVLNTITTDENTSPSFEIVSEPPAVISEKKKEEKEELKSDISGKISVQSYSNISNNGSNFDYQRWRYKFRLDAKNIGNSNLSYIHYLNFAYRANDWKSISSNLGDAIRIYDLAIKYDFSDQSSLWFGRHLNSKISNISAIDGLQYEHNFSGWAAGAIIGSRPDFKNMGFNLKLFEYGVYLNRFDDFTSGNMSNTLSYFEQTNDSKTDRRFVYFQHTNSAIENTRLFLSTEVDLFKKEMGKAKTEPSLTSLFVSANIRPSNVITFYLSYDARKNVIYYETFKSIADSILENETRQGFRTRVTLKPVRSLYIGANYGYRFRPGDVKPSNNYGGYITYSAIPFVDLSSTLSFTSLASSYVKGNIWGIQVSKSITNGVDLSILYRNIKYKFRSGIDDLDQHSFTVNLFTSLLKPISLNLSYEGLFEKIRTSGRILVNLAYRF